MQDNPDRVVTKYQFSSLFSAAWYKVIRPETIVNGFRKVAFDSTTISVPDVPACENPSDIGPYHESDDNAVLRADLFAECELTEETELHVMDMRSNAAQAIH